MVNYRPSKGVNFIICQKVINAMANRDRRLRNVGGDRAGGNFK